MEKLYSTIFIVDISQNPDEVDTVASRIQQLIEDHGGIIKNIDRWGKRRLAYPIRKKTHGFYVEIEYNASSRLNIPRILEGEFRLNDRVLRHFTYIVDKMELIQRAKNAGKAKVKSEAKKIETEDSEKTIESNIAKQPENTEDIIETKTPDTSEILLKDEQEHGPEEKKEEEL